MKDKDFRRGLYLDIIIKVIPVIIVMCLTVWLFYKVAEFTLGTATEQYETHRLDKKA